MAYKDATTLNSSQFGGEKPAAQKESLTIPAPAGTTVDGAIGNNPAPAEAPIEEVSPPSSSEAITAPATLRDVLGRSGDGVDQLGTALAGLFNLWNKELSAMAGTAPCSKASAAGLSCYEREGSLYRLVRLNRPAIIGIRKADRGVVYALLAGFDGNIMRLAVDGYEIRAPRDEVNALMAGPFLMLWKPPPGYRGLIVQGQRGETVEWLRSELAKILGHEVSIGSGDLFDAELARAVREFQVRSALKVDGVVGVETLTRVNTASLGDELPTLD